MLLLRCCLNIGECVPGYHAQLVDSDSTGHRALYMAANACCIYQHVCQRRLSVWQIYGVIKL